MDSQKYKDDKEAKGYQFVIEKLTHDQEQSRIDITKILSEKEAERVAYEARIAAREAQYLEGIKQQERLKVQNENLNKELITIREKADELTKEVIEQKTLINRLFEHEKNNQQQTELNKQSITKLEATKAEKFEKDS